MLSRTANDLFWMGRYVERAENTARMLDVTWRMSLLPTGDRGAGDWSAALQIGGGEDVFMERYGSPNARNIIEYMVLDGENPSSIYSVFRQARENARATRGTTTTELWQSLNDTWLEVNALDYDKIAKRGFTRFFDWVKERSHLFRGVSTGTMLRDDAYFFQRLGTFLERADNTARLLDVKYHILLPAGEPVGGAIDYYQWGALLRSVSAFSAYKRRFHDAIWPQRVAELLILHGDMPRSLHSCYRELDGLFAALRELYRRDFECFRLAGKTYSRLRYGRAESIFQRGLHEYLAEFLDRNADLGAQISSDFMLGN